MQNISRITERVTGSGRNYSDDLTFIQELDLSFATSPQPHTSVRPDPAITANVVRGTFEGTYEGGGRTVRNLSLTGNANNKGLFATVGALGTVQNLTMVNNVLQGGTNNGSFASINNGTINNIAFVFSEASLTGSVASTPPVSGTSYGGIVHTNGTTGKIDNALFIARAPNLNPIAAVNNNPAGIGENVYYLSGSIAGRRTSTVATAQTTLSDPAFNDYTAATGRPATTQELNALNLDLPWRRSLVQSTDNTMTERRYPYPFKGSAPASSPPEWWPVATIPAVRILYYETYADRLGFDFDGYGTAYGLRNNEPITQTGYRAIVPRAGGYSIRSENGSRHYLQAQEYRLNGNPLNPIFYIDLQGFVPATGRDSVRVFVNDVDINDLNSRRVNTLFARAAHGGDASLTTFSIRTAAQMLNISGIATQGLTFIQERDIDFGGTSRPSVVGDFTGRFDGRSNRITGLVINAPTTDNVGLFRVNRGTIENVILSGAAITGRNYVGGIAGRNEGGPRPAGGNGVPADSEGGLIRNSSVINTTVTGADFVGGISGRNDGVYAGDVQQRNFGRISEWTVTNVTLSGTNQGTVAGAGNAGIITLPPPP
jgi:hypothetical protein